MSRIKDLGGRGVTQGSDLGATIGGSTSAHAALSQQNDATALTLAATSVTGIGTVSWVWTVVGPSGDETAQIITAGSTTASPTWAAFTAATGKTCGNWVIKAVATDAAGQTLTFVRTVQVGALVTIGGGSQFMRLGLNIDCTAAATDNYADADGTQTLGGISWTSRNGVAGADTFGVLNGTGLQFAPKSDKVFNATIRTCPMLDVALTTALPAWSRRTAFAVQVVYTWTTPPAANISHLRLFASDIAPTTASGGENIVSCMDEYSGGVVRSVSNTIRNGTGATYNTAAGPSQGMELVFDGTGFGSGYSTADPGSAIVAPSTWTRHPVSATAGDTGGLPWSARSAGTALAADASARVGFAFSRDATGTAIAGHLEHIRFWIGD